MKHLVSVIWVVMVVLGAVVTGCEGARRYDSRLAAADSLMRVNPDSALALVERVCRDSLNNEGDCAYRDLLLTQARYRCYISATSDSDINRALAWFRAHPSDHEKLTRAYIYKGAVMEELGHPDSAMLYYKTAEVTASPDDYFNLGQINTRIGDLYRIYYADKQICYDKYRKALEYYRVTGNKNLQLNSLYNMGMCSGITGNGNSGNLLDSAALMAIELNDSSAFYDCREMSVRQLSMSDSTRPKAKQIAFHLLNRYKGFLTSDLLLDLAYIYDKDHVVDSAKYYVRYAIPHSVGSSGRIRVRAYEIMADIADYEGNKAKSYLYLDSCKYLSDSIFNNRQKYSIQFIENNENELLLSANDKKAKERQLCMVLVVVFGLAFPMLVFIFYQYRRIRLVKSIHQEVKNVRIDTHEALLEHLHAKESSVELLVQNIVSFLRTVIDTTEHDSPSVIRKRIKDSIYDVANEDFWEELRSYLDRYHNNIISEIAKNEKINTSDLRFIELECCGFSYVEIAITMGYSPKFVSIKRKRIAKKMGLKVSLQDFLTNAMNPIKP